jgi:hypothetical protein
MNKPPPKFAGVELPSCGTREANKKGGSTQSRPNLTNHHYKEPEQNT